MQVKRSPGQTTPGYPTKRELLSRGFILGAAAVTLGTLAAGCTHHRPTGGAIPIEPRMTRTAGLPAAEPRVDSYVVQKGDTLYGIAQRWLGDGNRWREIAAANPGITPGNLQPGQTLRLPDASPK